VSILAAACGGLPAATEFTRTSPVSLSARPGRLTFNADGTGIYAAGKRAVQLLHLDSGTVEQLLEISIEPLVMLLAPDGRSLVLVGVTLDASRTGQVLKIDLGAKALKRTTDLDEGFFSVGAAFSHDGRRVYVCNTNLPVLTVLDAESLEVVDRIRLGGGGCFGLAVSRPDGRVILTHPFEDRVTVVDAGRGKIVDVLPGIGTVPVAIVPGPTGERFYVIDNGAPFVSTLERAGSDVKAGGKIPTARFPFPRMGTREQFLPFATGAVLDNDAELFVWTPYLPHVVVIDLRARRPKSVIPLPEHVTHVAIDPSGKAIAVTRSDDPGITVISR
jgi:DNA-binding beta-propeller fold protein YncE